MNMKKLFWKSRTFVQVLSMGIILLVLVSCKSLDPAIVASATSSASAATHTHDTIVQRDTVYRHDSVIYRERTIHDTVYVTKEVYRDRLEARGERQKAVRTDTVVVTEWREKVIELPPERYVPKFYKWCTGLLWAIGLLVIGYWALKRWL